MIPLVDSSYRTVAYRALYGASNGGLFVVYALLAEPMAFNAFIASSPMLDACAELLERMASTTLKRTMPPRQLYLVYSDDDCDRVVDGVPRFVALLEAAQPPWLRWSSEVRHNEGHVPVVDAALALDPDDGLARRVLERLPGEEQAAQDEAAGNG